MVIKKFTKDDFQKWQVFRESKSSTILNTEYRMLCRLHAKYYNHKYYEPCTCSKKKIKLWIKDLNHIWNLGE